ncbi:hypothetical protein L2U69_04345 [Zavarzinia compransoris]|uniref:hypothetical protein n=1 Tax=Zavarzinia marina TaxID=2911065 RepID=UPI001F48A151|nr:hypothetical protein [Zavarzinia marina]MCF4164868.1 hypothetical protein [Zavarzinia marina]
MATINDITFGEASVDPDSVEPVSVSPNGMYGNSGSFQPAISADGRFVAFASNASNLVPGDTNGITDIFVHDRLAGTIDRVSVSSTGHQATSGPTIFDTESADPSISADGRFVVFSSASPNLVVQDTNGASDIFIRDRLTGTTTLVSLTDGNAQADSSSIRPSISADGRYVAFVSYASDLVAGDTNNVADIFVRDLETGDTRRVSVATDGSQADNLSFEVSISADGRYVAFQSHASNLVAGDTNGIADIFVHDLVTGETERVSVATDGGQATGASDNEAPAISADGRYVAFHSGAADLVADDTNNQSDVFLRDRQTGTTTRVSVSGDGSQAGTGGALPSLSADGRYVAFVSSASNLAGGDTNGVADVFVHDTVAGTTVRVSTDADGAQWLHASTMPSISGDGSLVAFRHISQDSAIYYTMVGNDIFVADKGLLQSTIGHPYNRSFTVKVEVQEAETVTFDWGDGFQTTTLPADGVASSSHGYNKDGIFELQIDAHAEGGGTTAGTTLTVVAATEVSGFTRTAAGDFYAATTAPASLSADGRYIAFNSYYAAPGVQTVVQAFVQDLETGDVTMISAAPDGTPDSRSSSGTSLSDNGRYVAFASEARNIVFGDTNGGSDIFVRDMVAGTTTRVSMASDGSEGNAHSTAPSISGNGRYIAFNSAASNLVDGDANNVSDIFVHDRIRGTTERVSISSNGTEANQASFQAPSISNDGRYVAFRSSATNLVSDDTNGRPDIFVHDRETGDTVRVSVSSSGTQSNDYSTAAAISGNGRYVAFESGASNLVAGDTNRKVDIFVHDLDTGATTRVSVSSDGKQANGDSNGATISDDGRFIVFTSDATNLVEGDTNKVSDIFRYDMVMGTIERVSAIGETTEAREPSRSAVISSDGRNVAFYTADDFLDGPGHDDIADIVVWHETPTTTQTITGTTAGDDVVLGSALPDEVSLGDGDDYARTWFGNDVLDGGAGNDVLDGGAGADAMSGGIGDDAYYVDDAGDTVTEVAEGGYDTVYATVSIERLAARVEALILQGVGDLDANGNNVANSITGTAGNNRIDGLGGDDLLSGRAGDDILIGGLRHDTLIGGGGADDMSGGDGDDRYHVDGRHDVVREAEGGGNDTVLTPLSGHALAANVENLVLTGTGALTGTGNALDNMIYGSGGADTNILHGLGGDDTLLGRDQADILNGGADGDILKGYGGNDLLRGGTGADIMIGGAGDDHYYVDDAGDQVTERADGGRDHVHASVSYTLSDEVENLTLEGTSTRGTGNDGANRITGNTAANVLSGGGGTDTLSGEDGDDILIGGAGPDHLTGGTGNDIFVLDAPGDGIDYIMDWSDGDLMQIDRAAFGLDASSPVAVGNGTATNGLTGDMFFYQTNMGRLYWHDADTGQLTYLASLETMPAALDLTDFVFV